MSLTSVLTVLPLAAEEGGAGARPFIVAGLILLLLLGAMVVLLAIGKGREHS